MVRHGHEEDWLGSVRLVHQCHTNPPKECQANLPTEPLGRSWGRLGNLLGGLGGFRSLLSSLGGVWESPGVSWGRLGTLLGGLGGVLGTSWGVLGASWEPLGQLFGVSWAPLESS